MSFTRGFGAGTLAGLLALSPGAAPAAAQAGVVDEGTFELFVEGRPAGTETFTIRQTGTGANAVVEATGTVEVDLPDGALALTPRLSARGLEATPVSYAVRVEAAGQPVRVISGEPGPGKFSQRTSAGPVLQLNEFVASSGAVILDEVVAHHYYFLAQRERSGEVPVIVPRQSRQVMATVRDLGEEPVSVGGRTVRLFHLVVQPRGGAERHVWVDALNRVVRVTIPRLGYEAVRTVVPQ